MKYNVSKFNFFVQHIIINKLFFGIIHMIDVYEAFIIVK